MNVYNKLKSRLIATWVNFKSRSITIYYDSIGGDVGDDVCYVRQESMMCAM